MNKLINKLNRRGTKGRHGGSYHKSVSRGWKKQQTTDMVVAMCEDALLSNHLVSMLEN